MAWRHPEFSEMDADTIPFFAALGRMTLEWNKVKAQLRGLLGQCVGQTNMKEIAASYILTAQLGSVGLSDALNGYAEHVLPQEAAPSVKHAVTYFDRIRGYRNYYTHNITATIPTTEGTAGHISAVDAKGKVVLRNDHVTITHINFVARHCHVLHHYLLALRTCLFYPPEALEFGPRPPLPDMPPLPDSLQKPGRRF